MKSSAAMERIVASGADTCSPSPSSSFPDDCGKAPVVKSSKPGKAANAEALFIQLSQVDFGLDENVRRDAFRLFRETEHRLVASTGAPGSETEGELVKCWIVSVIYCAFRLSRGSHPVGANGVTLTKLLTSINSPVMTFFKELSYFLQKADPVLRSMYGDACDAFKQELRQVQANYVHLSALYDNYEKNFSKFFVLTEELLEEGPSSNAGGGVEKLIYLRFGWMLFLALRMHIPGHFVDLMTCANGLIAIFVIMIIHMPAHLRKVSLDDSSTFAVCSSKGVDIISSLCHLYDASEVDVKTMLGKANCMIQSLVESSQKPSLLIESEQTAGMDTEGVTYFQGLMEKRAMLSYMKILDKNYAEVYNKQGDIDERSFLPESSFASDLALDSLSGSDEMLWSKCAKRKYDMISSPSKPIALKANVSTEGGSLPSSTMANSHKMPPPTPVSVSMNTAKWLCSVIVPLPAEPSPELISYFRSCDTNITKEVIYRAQLLLEFVFSIEAIKSSAIGDVKVISSLSSVWALQRRLEALKLYYKVLGAMCKAEAQRLHSNNLSALLTNERFHRCMLACSAEVVLATHKTVSMAFPAVLDPMGITAFDLSKVIESFVRHEETLPRELKRHLNSIEERLLEMLAWEKGSSMYNSLIIAKPHLRSEIHRLGLLADPMPSLEGLKHQYQISNESSPLLSLRTKAEPVTEDLHGPLLPSTHGPLLSSTSVPTLPIREVDATSSAAPLSSMILSPVRDRSSAFSAFTPTKALVQPPLLSAFASPQRMTSAGGGETCAEIVINIFFQKVLKLAAIRTKLLCEILKRPNHLMEDVYKLVQHLLYQETHLFFKRHIDQIILCSLYGVSKVKLLKVTFKEVVQHYKQTPQHKSYVFRTVFLDPRAGGQETGDIIQFYNDVFIPLAKAFLIQLSTQLISSSGNDDGDRTEGSPGPSPFQSLPDASPKKVSASHNVYVSPLKTSKVLSPHSRRLYACFGESTHAYQSPSKDLTDINKRLNNRRLGRLDFGDVGLINDSIVARDLASQNCMLRK